MATTSRLLQLIILRFSTHGEPENMTIGSTHNPPADLAIDPSLPMQPWAARFPNPPDSTTAGFSNKIRLGNNGVRAIL